jgi:molybdopterin synthase catalytic subunit
VTPQPIGCGQQRPRRPFIIEFVVELHAVERTCGLCDPFVGVIRPRRPILCPVASTRPTRREPVQLPTGDDWLALTPHPLPVSDATGWAVRADCGAVVTFTGTVRDHAAGRAGVTGLTYEAYDAQVLVRLAAIATEARRRWPMTGRLGLLHRTGRLRVGEASVLVVASCPHRGEAFEVARFAIDTLKATVPIWKSETWEDGTDWGTAARPISEVEAMSAGEQIASGEPICEARA